MGRRACAVLAFCVLLVAARALPASAQPVLTASAAVDDSAGDNNQTLEPGETALLVVTVANAGDQDATTVAATLSSSTPGVTITDSGPKSYGTIASSQSGDAPFGISLDKSYTCGNDLTFSIAITSDQGPTNQDLTESVPCPTAALDVSKVSLIDATTHDPVTGAAVGQTVDVAVQLSNSGTADATNVIGTLSGPGANITHAEANYGTIAAGADKSGTFQLVPTVCPQSDSLAFALVVKSDQSTDGLSIEVPIDCKRLGVSFKGGTFDDRTSGNGDGVPQPGETGLVYLSFFNGSDAPITGIKATLDVDAADVSGGPVTVPDLQPGELQTSSTALTVHFHEDAPTTFGPGPSPEPTVSAEPSTTPEPTVSAEPTASPTTTLSAEPSVSPEPTTTPEPSVTPEPTSTGPQLVAPDCGSFYPLAGFGSATDSGPNPFQFVSISGVRISGIVHLTSDQGSADFLLATTAVCAVTLAAGGHSPIPATGGGRLDLLWLALAILACGAGLRRASAVRL